MVTRLASTAQKRGLIIGTSVAAVVVAVTGAFLAMYFLGVFRKKSDGGAAVAPSRRPGFTCVPSEQKCVFAADNGADPATRVYATAAECKCWQCDAGANACRFVLSNTEEGNAATPTPTPAAPTLQRPGYTCTPASQTCKYNDVNGGDPAINVYSTEKECKCWKCSEGSNSIDTCRFVTSNAEAGDFGQKEDCNCKYSCIAA